jgi:phosphatidylserine decarboxylase
VVGSIGHSVQEGELVRRGDELGYFAFGGSTCILLMENGKVEWDEDLRLNCQASLETLVQYGTKIGHRVQAQPQRPALDGKRSSSSGGKATVPTV